MRGPRVRQTPSPPPPSTGRSRAPASSRAGQATSTAVADLISERLWRMARSVRSSNDAGAPAATACARIQHLPPGELQQPAMLRRMPGLLRPGASSLTNHGLEPDTLCQDGTNSWGQQPKELAQPGSPVVEGPQRPGQGQQGSLSGLARTHHIGGPTMRQTRVLQLLRQEQAGFSRSGQVAHSASRQAL